MSKIFCQSATARALVLTAGICGCSAPPAEHTIDHNDSMAPKLGVFPRLDNSLLRHLDLARQIQGTSDITFPFCIRTLDLPRDPAVEADVLSWATRSMNTWIEPLIGEDEWGVTSAQAYRVDVDDNNECPRSDQGVSVYTIRIRDMQGGSNSPAGMTMQMGAGGLPRRPYCTKWGMALASRTRDPYTVPC